MTEVSPERDELRRKRRNSFLVWDVKIMLERTLEELQPYLGMMVTDTMMSEMDVMIHSVVPGIKKDRGIQCECWPVLEDLGHGELSLTLDPCCKMHTDALELAEDEG